MKVDITSLNLESFSIKDGFVAGQAVQLITPKKMGAEWNLENLHLRSTMVDFEGNIISFGLPKFFNLGEKSELYPSPSKFNDWVITSKEDGSLLICDYIYDIFNARTRGTISYTNHENTEDFNYVIDKYKLKELVAKYPNYSILFEIYSPRNVIVLKPYSEPEIVFLGMMDKTSGVYIPFYSTIGREVQFLINCKIPELFSFTDDLVTIAEKIKTWEGREGVVLHYNNSQNHLKIKSEWYLMLHRFKSNATLENTLDLFVSFGYPPFVDFETKLIEQFDYECYQMVRGFASLVCDAYKQVKEIQSGMERFVTGLGALPRRDAAGKIIASYGSTGRAAMCFTLLDGKPLSDEQIVKLIWQKLKD